MPGERPATTADSRLYMFRPRKMNETISGVEAGVAPVAAAFASTIGPSPCATATSPAGADDGEAVNDDAWNDGIPKTPRAATSTAAAASAAAMTKAAIRRPPESLTEWSPQYARSVNIPRHDHGGPHVSTRINHAERRNHKTITTPLAAAGKMRNYLNFV